jgi:peptide/nickel transport system permease protein
MKNGLLPVLTLAGLHLSGIIGGSVLIETVFAIPGMGRLAVDSLFNRDYLVIQGVTVVFAGVIILVNLMVDVAYGWFDPRVRYR